MRLAVLALFLTAIVVITIYPRLAQDPGAEEDAPFETRPFEANLFPKPPPGAVLDARTALEGACRGWRDKSRIFLSGVSTYSAESPEGHACEALLQPGDAEGRSFFNGTMAGVFGLIVALVALFLFRATMQWLWRLPAR